METLKIGLDGKNNTNCGHWALIPQDVVDIKLISLNGLSLAWPKLNKKDVHRLTLGESEAR